MNGVLSITRGMFTVWILWTRSALTSRSRNRQSITDIRQFRECCSGQRRQDSLPAQSKRHYSCSLPGVRSCNSTPWLHKEVSECTNIYKKSTMKSPRLPASSTRLARSSSERTWTRKRRTDQRTTGRSTRITGSNCIVVLGVHTFRKGRNKNKE